MKKFERRDFIKTSAILTAGSSALFFGCNGEKKNESVNIITNKKYEWKLVTAWPPHYPLLGEYAEKFTEMISRMSSGRLKIQVYGGGELVPPLETFDAVSQGLVEMGHSASYYWAGKLSASQFFTSVPFGMNSDQSNSWLNHGGGLKLWEEMYSPFNIIPFCCGNTGGQMGGWFRKEIHTISDIKGLKIRMAGLGGKIINKLGASTILSPGAELYTNLERGVIDALEWIGPYHDYLMGFQRIAPYYYYPGWQEPTGILELLINKNAFESLPIELQDIVRYSADAVNTQCLAEFNYRNAEYLEKIKFEGKVQLKKYSDELLKLFRETTHQIISEITAKDVMSKKVYESYSKFQKQITQWSDVAEINYL
jgi:TRAP-type mannitol/chloroaromatic compound transport system substrate-binding protein